MKEIQMQPVSSSMIHSIGHDAGMSTLAVRFKNKDGSAGSLHHYTGVSLNDFESLKDAPSIGSHFGSVIKGNPDQYPHKRVD